MPPKARILLLNYNGKTLLENYLPSFIEAARRSKFGCAVSVIDNASKDGSVEWLRSRYPEVGVIALPVNKVLCAYNDAAPQLQEDILIFMNNDIRADADFVDPLLRPFESSRDVFFVTPRCLSMADGRYEGNRTKAVIRFGLFWSSSIYPGYEKDAETAGPTFHGGFGAFDRQKFLELGGYDDLYLPGRLEDADICFRARRLGWKCLYEPESVVRHEGGTSFHKRFGARGTLVINWKNTFLFMCKNLSDPGIWARFFFWLPARLVYSLVSGKPEFALGFLQAIPRAAEAFRRRTRSPGVPDRELFDGISQ